MQKFAHNGGRSLRCLSSIQDWSGDFGELQSTLWVVCSSRRMSSGGLASDDPATQFPGWTISLNPQVSGSHWRALLVRARLPQGPAGVSPRRLLRLRLRWPESDQTDHQPRSRDSWSLRSCGRHRRATRCRHLQAASWFYKADRTGARAETKSLAPRSPVYIRRQWRRSRCRSSGGSHESFRHVDSETPRLERRPAPSARHREALDFEACWTIASSHRCSRNAACRNPWIPLDLSAFSTASHRQVPIDSALRHSCGCGPQRAGDCESRFRPRADHARLHHWRMLAILKSGPAAGAITSSWAAVSSLHGSLEPGPKTTTKPDSTSCTELIGLATLRRSRSVETGHPPHQRYTSRYSHRCPRCGQVTTERWGIRDLFVGAAEAIRRPETKLFVLNDQTSVGTLSSNSWRFITDLMEKRQGYRHLVECWACRHESGTFSGTFRNVTAREVCTHPRITPSE